jgi:hypothetical protein
LLARNAFAFFFLAISKLQPRRYQLANYAISYK